MLSVLSADSFRARERQRWHAMGLALPNSNSNPSMYSREGEQEWHSANHVTWCLLLTLHQKVHCRAVCGDHQPVSMIRREDKDSSSAPASRKVQHFCLSLPLLLLEHTPEFLTSLMWPHVLQMTHQSGLPGVNHSHVCLIRGRDLPSESAWGPWTKLPSAHAV